VEVALSATAMETFTSIKKQDVLFKTFKVFGWQIQVWGTGLKYNVPLLGFAEVKSSIFIVIFVNFEFGHFYLP